MGREFENQRAHIRWNDEMAHKYDPEDYHLKSNFLIRLIEKYRVHSIVEFLNVQDGDSVLEVGCGAGNVLEKVLSSHLVGIDLSSFLLAKSKRRLGGKRAFFIQADGECLPFSSHKFTHVYCTEVLEHVINPRHIAKEMARVVKKQGIIVISIPNETLIDHLKTFIRKLHLNRLFFGGKETYHVPDSMTDEWHLHHFDLQYLQNVVAEILLIEHVKPIPCAAFPIRYVVKARVIY